MKYSIQYDLIKRDMHVHRSERRNRNSKQRLTASERCCYVYRCVRVQEKGKRERERGVGERSIRGQSADHVGTAPVAPGVATCQITHLARVNNYSETRVIALHYAYISHVACPVREACVSSSSSSSPSSRAFAAVASVLVPRRKVPSPLLLELLRNETK